MRVRVLHRPAGFRVHVAGPGDRHVGFRGDELAVGAIEHVEETVLRRLHDHLAHLAVDLDVREDHVLSGGVVPGIAGCGLVVPDQRAVIRIDGQHGGDVQIVAAARRADVAVPGRAVTDADVEQVQLGIEGHGIPDSAAAADFPPLAAPPGAGGHFHGAVLEAVRRVAGHGVEAPGLSAGRRVVSADVAAHAVFGAAVADDDLVFDDARRAGDGVRAFAIGGLHLPDQLAGTRVKRNQPAIQRAGVDAAFPGRDAAIDHVTAGELTPFPRHLRIVGPEQLAGLGVVSPDH